MASDFQSPHPLATHLRALYPLARVLVEPEAASSLVRHVYEEAAAVPPEERPADERAWLLRLMLKAQDVRFPTDEEELPAADSSFTDDSFRQEVAEELAAEKLPVAFAACSIRERFILTIDALAPSAEEVLAATLDVPTETARSLRERTRAGLRASLRDVLNGPERMLIDVALPDDTLRDCMREMLTDRFPSAPPSLRSDVSNILGRAPAHQESNGAWLPLPASWIPSLSIRGVLGVLLMLALFAAAVGGLTYMTPSSSSPQDVIALSVQRAPALQAAHPASTPSQARRYLRGAWHRRVSPPQIDGASLQGVARTTVAEVRIPALVYADDERGEKIVVYAFNYALLDQLGDRLSLPHSLRTELTAPSTVVSQQHDDQTALLWRHQDDIMVLVTPAMDAETLRSRLHP